MLAPFLVKAAALVLAATHVTSAAAASLGDVAPAEIERAKPGGIIRIWPLVGAGTPGAKAYRVLYRSTGLSGEAIPVTAAILFPDTPAPPGGRPVIAWAHPTTGVVERCAPTTLPGVVGSIMGLEEMMSRGYVVAATDYPGLGTPGVHPYLIGESEARAVLDSVRAARELPDAKAQRRFAVWGHSQGGHASLFTGELAASYAPELELVGVAAAAPATYLADLFTADRASQSGHSLTAMTIWSWSRLFKLPIEGLVEPQAMRSYEKVAGDCIETIGEFLTEAQDEQPLQHSFLAGDPTKMPAWRAIMDRNTPGQAPAGAPMFIAQGTADTTVPPRFTRKFAEAVCRRGTPVRFVELDGDSHTFIARDSAFAAVEWMTARFAGSNPPSDCPR